MALVYSHETGFKNVVIKSSALETIINQLINESRLISVHRYGNEYEIRYASTLETRPVNVMWIKRMSTDLERILIKQPSYAVIKELSYVKSSNKS